ncbi:MAG: radical SAM protein [Candidatus Methanoperedens sp.]|nr:radical SAM protein [Candidatus Methanoperedens sp.]
MQRLQTIFLNVTDACNLRCSHCYANAKKSRKQCQDESELNLDEITNLAVEAKKLGAERVNLTGGEPFLRKDWFEIFKIFNSLDFLVGFSSNGTLINRKIASCLSKFTNVEFLISLDGDRENHELMRGVPNSFDKTIKAIRLLQDMKIPLQINTTINKANYSSVPFLTKFSRDEDLSLRLTLLNCSTGRGKENKDKALSTEQIVNLINYCHEVRQRGSLVFLNLPPLLLQTEDIIPIGNPSCGWAKGLCGVLPNGNVSICALAYEHSELSAGNLRENSLEEIWLSSNLFNDLRKLETQELEGICGKCRFRDICGGGCRLSAYLNYNSFLGPCSICQEFYDKGLLKDELLTS